MFSNQDDPNLKINVNATSSSSSSGEVKNKPTSDLKGKKEFKKLLQDPTASSEDPEMIEAADESLGEALAMDDAPGKKKAPPSIFQLTSSAAQGKKPSMLEEEADAVQSTPTDSPNKLFSKLSTGAKKADTSSNAGALSDLEEEEELEASAKTALPPIKQEKFTMKFSSEQQDLSYINPMNLSTQSIDAADIGDKDALPTAHINQLVTQMVDTVQEMKDNGKTDTTVTLKYPPLFAGANLTVTTYDSAKGEFNVSFDNLRNEAKTLLDMLPNREALQQSLIDKGYTVHIITTNTLAENRIMTTPSEQTADRRDQGKQQRQRRDQDEDQG